MLVLSLAETVLVIVREYIMLVRTGSVAIAMLCGLAISGKLVSHPSNSRQLSIRYVEEGEKTKVLADHTLALGADGRLNFRAGGEAESDDGEPAIRFGTLITGKLMSIDDDSYKVSVSLTLGSPVSCDVPATQIVRSECVELRMVLDAGRKTKVPCGGGRWMELRLDN